MTLSEVKFSGQKDVKNTGDGCSLDPISHNAPNSLPVAITHKLEAPTEGHISHEVIPSGEKMAQNFISTAQIGYEIHT